MHKNLLSTAKILRRCKINAECFYEILTEEGRNTLIEVNTLHNTAFIKFILALLHVGGKTQNAKYYG